MIKTMIDKILTYSGLKHLIHKLKTVILNEVDKKISDFSKTIPGNDWKLLWEGEETEIWHWFCTVPEEWHTIRVMCAYNNPERDRNQYSFAFSIYIEREEYDLQVQDKDHKWNDYTEAYFSVPFGCNVGIHKQTRQMWMSHNFDHDNLTIKRVYYR